MRATRRAPAAFFGRQCELATVSDALERATHGTFQAVVLEGEAGIGKTRLLEAGLDQAQGRGFCVVDALARSGFEPASAPSDSGHSKAGADDDPGHVSRFRLVEGALERVEAIAVASPVVVPLDDLQWVDLAALLTVRAMAARLRHLPVALLLALRSGDDIDAVTSIVQEIVSAGAVHLTLGPLADETLSDVVTAETGARPDPHLRRLLQDVGGNPLYALELVRALDAEGSLTVQQGEAIPSNPAPPSSLQAAVLRRLRHYGPDAIQALRVGATLGTSFAVIDLAAVMDRSVVQLLHALDRPIRAGILGEHDGRLTFRHPLLRQAIYQELPQAVRDALHLEAGRRLASARRPARVVAPHLAVGAQDGDQEAIGWLRRAADDVLASDPAEAVRLLRRALDLGSTGDATRSRVEASLIACLAWAGQLSDAVSVGQQALDRAPTRDARARLRAGLGRALLLHGWYGDALEHFEAALAEGGLDRSSHSGLLGETAIAHLYRGELDRAAELTVAIQDDGQPSLGAAADAWIAAIRGEFDRAYRMAAAAAKAADWSAAPTAVRPLTMLAGAWDRVDRTAEAEELLTTKLREVEDAGGVHDVASRQCVLGMLRFQLGRWDDAKADLDSGLGLADELGVPALSVGVCPYATRAALAVHERDLATAAAVLDDPACRTDVRLGLDSMWWARGILHEARGDPAAGLEALTEGWNVCTRFGFRSEQPLLGPDLVRLAVTQGHRNLARKATHAVVEVAEEAGTDTARAATLQCRGLLDGDPDALLEAVSIYRRVPRPPLLAATREDAGRVCADAGYADKAQALLLEAADGYARLGARWDTDRVDALLRQRGVRRGARGVRHRPQSGWTSLTDREREVAELVADGLTNRQIGERLYVSPRTVSTHISNVLTKLNLRSRVELGIGVAIRARSGNAEPVPKSSDGLAGGRATDRVLIRCRD